MTSDRWPKRACLEVELDGRQRAAVGAGQGRGDDLAALRHDVLLRADRRRCCRPRRRAAHRRDREALVRPHLAWTASSPPATPCSCRRTAPPACAVEPETRRRAALRRGDGRAAAPARDRDRGRRRGRLSAWRRIVVRGEQAHVEPVARAVANSPLVKTALHGGDPNFGRILQAAGMVYPPGNGFVVDLEIEGRQVVSAGEAVVDDLRELEPLVATATRWSTRSRCRARAARPRSSSATCRRST